MEPDQQGTQVSALLGNTDFRAKATLGVAKAALCLLLPLTILNFVDGNTSVALVSSYVLVLLVLNVYLVVNSRCHENVTTYGLVLPGMVLMSVVFQHNAIVASLWCYPAIIACYCMLSRHRAVYVNLFILTMAVPQAIRYLGPEYSTRIAATLIAISLFSFILVRTIDQLNSRLQQRLLRDPLTGLLNRLSMKDSLQEAVSLHKTHSQAATLLAVDIDYFKSINDRFGHEAGDLALTKLASIFDNNLRDTDKAFRTGGEEFLILMPATREKEAYKIAERLRRKIELADIIPGDSMTISVGAAQLRQGEDWQQWNKRADDHLYEAKRLGRNRVTLSNRKHLNVIDIRKNAARTWHDI